MRIYLAGKIRGVENYREKFEEKKEELESLGYEVLTPMILPLGMEHHQYMHICFSMIDVCEGVYFLKNWVSSEGAIAEMDYASKIGKWTMVEVDEKQKEFFKEKIREENQKGGE